MSKIPKTLRAHCARNIRFQGKIFWEVHFIIEPSHISNEHKILRTQQLELPGSYKKSLLSILVSCLLKGNFLFILPFPVIIARK